MNVAFDPWIPVVAVSGERRLASLCSVLVEGEKYIDLAVRPHERVALMRLFLCVAHAALDGPRNYDEWCEVPKRLSEAARTYLTAWMESFELFHPTKPWLQVATLSKTLTSKAFDPNIEDWTPVSKLNFSFATGNNSTLFDHTGMSENRSTPIHETLLSFLTFQCFSPGGLISQVYWNGTQSPKSSKDGPCVPASMIHTFLRGRNLLRAIHLNIPSFQDIHFSYGKGNIGKPVWEMFPASITDSVCVKNATASYVGRLVPMPRLIFLHPSGERMLLGDGLVYPPFTEGFPAEPTATVVIKKNEKKEERTLLSYRPAKALWRELAAVIVKRSAEGTGGPLSLRSIQDDEECDLVVAALARDQATIVDIAESVFHIPIRLRSIEGTSAYESEVKVSESIAGRLGWAIETYRGEIDGGWEGRLKGAGSKKSQLKAKLHSKGTTYYWTNVEKSLNLLIAHIEAIGTDEAISTREIWRYMLFATAREAYRIVCGHETPRQMRAFAKGWQKLTTKKDKSETDKSDKETREENP